jgi:hypothetical protein
MRGGQGMEKGKIKVPNADAGACEVFKVSRFSRFLGNYWNGYEKNDKK